MPKKKKKRPTGPVTEEEVHRFLKWSDPTNLLSNEALMKAGDGDWVVGGNRIRISTVRSANCLGGFHGLPPHEFAEKIRLCAGWVNYGAQKNNGIRPIFPAPRPTQK